MVTAQSPSVRGAQQAAQQGSEPEIPWGICWCVTNFHGPRKIPVLNKWGEITPEILGVKQHQ